MRPPLRRLLAALVLAAVLAAVLAGAAAAQSVRVLLLEAPRVEVVAEGAHRGSVDGVPAFTTPLGLRWPVSEEGGRLVVEGRSVGRTLLFEGSGAPLEVGGHRYRGALRLTATAGGIEVVNELDIEAYLRGVVPAEMAPSWPMEALKAQAVAARSYTLSKLAPQADYDLCATVDCQVYRGMDAEHPRSDEAVAQTRGVIVSYAGGPARTYYHADSGGEVASSQEVWGMALPYLVARPDVEGSSPHRQWRATLDPLRVAASLAGLGRDVGAVRAVRVVGLSESGRVAALEIRGSSGTTVVEGALLTSLARGWGLKSTLFRSAGGLTVTGQGWGHGVGMSQYGARTLAAESYDYQQILAFYYPTTRLVRRVTATTRSAAR
jgi:stage II sporulation protein D